MRRKTIILVAVSLLSLVALTAVFGANTQVFAQELVEYSPYPSLDKTSPSFGEYDNVAYKDGYTAKTINKSMSAYEIYMATNENFRNTQYMAQISTTVSDINITATTRPFGILNAGLNFGVKQVSSLITANDALGNNYYQAISQMETLGEDLKALDMFSPNFGFWEKRKYIAEDKTTYIQSGISGTKKYDPNYVGGITCTWKNKVTEEKQGDDVYDVSVFDMTERVFENTETEDYKVVLSTNPNNVDEKGNLIIKVNYKTSSGGWSGDYWYMWDDVGGTTEGKYTYFVEDRNQKAWPARGDSLSNMIVNENTFDTANTKLEVSEVEGKTLYTLDIVLKEQGPYSWELITSGEKKYLQDGTKGFVDFPMEYAEVRSDAIFKLEVWDNGSVRRIIRQYTMDLGSAGGDAKGADKTSVLGGQAYGYGYVTNTQYQEFAYDGAPVDFLGDSYVIGDGVTDPWLIVGIVAGILGGLLIVLVIVLVVLKKKGIIGKNKKKSDKDDSEQAKNENAEEQISSQENSEKNDNLQ